MNRILRSDATKRVFDIVVAAIALVVLSPVILVIALAVRLTMGSPILFRQERPGLHGVPFTILKFRTMSIARPGEELTDTQRTTRLGHWLRSLSLDELPELWNVIRGDMSLVGPRPLLMVYLSRYTPEQARRHEVRPGITGLAQVGGRNAIDWDQRFALDLKYVDSHDLRMDISVLARTVAIVLKREGINSSSDETMPEYMGSGSTGSTGEIGP
jgi:lipopolysaccharide/colanic/teichoic acid biosynthesis glycosyltransferase